MRIMRGRKAGEVRGREAGAVGKMRGELSEV